MVFVAKVCCVAANLVSLIDPSVGSAFALDDARARLPLTPDPSPQTSLERGVPGFLKNASRYSGKAIAANSSQHLVLSFQLLAFSF